MCVCRQAHRFLHFIQRAHTLALPLLSFFFFSHTNILAELPRLADMLFQTSRTKDNGTRLKRQTSPTFPTSRTAGDERRGGDRAKRTLPRTFPGKHQSQPVEKLEYLLIHRGRVNSEVISSCTVSERGAEGAGPAAVTLVTCAVSAVEGAAASFHVLVTTPKEQEEKHGDSGHGEAEITEAAFDPSRGK